MKVLAHLSFGREDLLAERHDFLLGRDHAENLLRLGELEFGDALEALFEMRLHAGGVLGL